MRYTVCDDAATLRWLGNQAALEFHPAPVRADRLDRPDLLVVDIDPPGDDAFEAAAEVAGLVLEVLDDAGIAPLVKTTGGKGLHVVVPDRTPGLAGCAPSGGRPPHRDRRAIAGPIW